jgi:hypothetical protein
MTSIHRASRTPGTPMSPHTLMVRSGSPIPASATRTGNEAAPARARTTAAVRCARACEGRLLRPSERQQRRPTSRRGGLWRSGASRALSGGIALSGLHVSVCRCEVVPEARVRGVADRRRAEKLRTCSNPLHGHLVAPAELSCRGVERSFRYEAVVKAGVCGRSHGYCLVARSARKPPGPVRRRPPSRVRATFGSEPVRHRCRGNPADRSAG